MQPFVPSNDGRDYKYRYINFLRSIVRLPPFLPLIHSFNADAAYLDPSSTFLRKVCVFHLPWLPLWIPESPRSQPWRVARPRGAYAIPNTSVPFNNALPGM